MKTLMRIAALAALTATAACGDDPSPVAADASPLPPVDAPQVDPTKQCAGDAEAFVSQAMLGMLGRRPYSADETQVYADLVRAAQAAGGGVDGRVVAAQAIMDDPAFVDRWQEHFMDALRVARIDDQDMSSCYGRQFRDVDDAELATFVRDGDPKTTTSGPDDGQFSMRDLVRSALVLDDISPVWRAHLFVLVSFPIPAANVPPVQAELARRQDYGQVFDSAYLNRDIVCLGCHNSAASVTDRDNPLSDRHWAMPGLFEESLYGDSQGRKVEEAHAVFRFDGFATNDGLRPWGWFGRCGEFEAEVGADIAEVQGYFAGLTGDQLTAFDLERALARGFEKLRTQGLQMDAEGRIADPEQAFAYLVSASIVEGVWREVMGTPLTIANYFPRTEVARDVLHALTERFIASGFSVRALLVAIVTSDYFNRLPPEAGCESTAYAYPRLYDPWVDSEGDPAMRKNSPADAVQPVSARALLRAAYAALGWQHPSNHAFPTGNDFCSGASCDDLNYYCNEFAACCDVYQTQCVQMLPPGPSGRDEQQFQRGIGVFLKNGERGFRGLDFQARLVWEERFGQCARPTAAPDAVDRLVELAVSRAATLEDLVVAMKDRLISEAFLSASATSKNGISERTLVEGIFGEPLDTPVRAEHITATRRLCGVLLSTPQFLLGGMAPRRAEIPPALVLPEAAYDTVCQTVTMRGLAGGLAATCGDRTVTITAE